MTNLREHPESIKQAARLIAESLGGLTATQVNEAVSKATEKLTRKRERLADRKFVLAITKALIKNRRLNSYTLLKTMAIEALCEVYPDTKAEKFRALFARLEKEADNVKMST